jgi:DNA recombination protein RmuC
VKRQTQTVLESIDGAQTRTRQMTKVLRQVEALPDAHAQQLLPGLLDGEPAEEDRPGV